ncbi:hypothetical protein [Leifsonia sp. WHRI 6310E]|uniref:hypothetical protein n=1 Tax=Leifsonia sp. WHRI 6310E TaxID=3162562 RepID=UPI0032EDB957
MRRWIRIVETALTATVAVTALAGGLALAVGSMTGAGAGGALPSPAYLTGSPFATYLLPGLILALVVGGTHVVAALLIGRGSRRGPFAVAVAGFGLLIWIFVQMAFIPFSPLQAAYFAAGLTELGLLLLALGLLPVERTSGRTVAP